MRRPVRGARSQQTSRLSAQSTRRWRNTTPLRRRGRARGLRPLRSSSGRCAAARSLGLDAVWRLQILVARVPLRACALDAPSPKKPPARQPRLLHRLIPAGRDPAVLVALRPLRPGSWPLSPSESAELGWGGPHSLRWEGGSVLAAVSPACRRVRLRPATARARLRVCLRASRALPASRASRASRACAAAALLVRPPVAASSSWRASCGLARAHVCETPGALLPSARPGPRTRLRPFSPLRCAQARGRAAAEARCSAALSCQFVKCGT